MVLMLQVITLLLLSPLIQSLSQPPLLSPNNKYINICTSHPMQTPSSTIPYPTTIPPSPPPSTAMILPLTSPIPSPTPIQQMEMDVPLYA